MNARHAAIVSLLLNFISVQYANMVWRYPMTQDTSASKEVPSRLSVDAKSIYYDAWAIKRIGVRIDGIDMPNCVHEYNVDEGWADIRKKTAMGRFVQVNGELVMKRKYGLIEPYWKEERFVAPPVPEEVQRDAQSKAEEKRLRRAAKRMSLVRTSE